MVIINQANHIIFKMINPTCAVIFILIFLMVWFMVFYDKCSKSLGSSKENLSGYGVTSGLAFNNRLAVCSPGNQSWSGGCFLPHRVIF